VSSFATSTRAGTLLPALHGCTLVEIDVNEGGQYAGRLLAAMGARVVKFESLEGDAMRSLAPFVHDRCGRRRSLPFEYFNAAKQSLALDFEDSFAFEVLQDFISAHPADTAVLASPRAAARLPATLQGLVIVAGPYGASGPDSQAPTTPFTRCHAGGNGYTVPGDDWQRFRPTVPGTLASECFSGGGIAMAVLGALLIRRTDATLAATQSPRVDFSQQAQSVNLEKMFIGRTATEGIEPTRETHRYPFGGAVRCSDGYVSMLINEMHQWHGLCDIIGQPEWAHDSRFAGGGGRWAMQDSIRAALTAWCSTRCVSEVLGLARARGVPMGAIRTVQEVLAADELRWRGFLGEAETPYGKVVDIGLPYGLADPMWSVRASAVAPLPGEHSAAILGELGHGPADIALFERLGLIHCESAH